MRMALLSKLQNSVKCLESLVLCRAVKLKVLCAAMGYEELLLDDSDEDAALR